MLPRLRLDLDRVSSAGIGVVRVHIVGRNHLDELVIVRSPRRFEIGGRRQMPSLSLALRKRVVRDALNERLEESVLATLRRARIGLQREDLLSNQRREERLELVG